MLVAIVVLVVALAASAAVLYRVAVARRSDFGLDELAAEQDLIDEQRRTPDRRDIRVVQRRSAGWRAQARGGQNASRSPRPATRRVEG